MRAVLQRGAAQANGRGWRLSHVRASAHTSGFAVTQAAAGTGVDDLAIKPSIAASFEEEEEEGDVDLVRVRVEVLGASRLGVPTGP